MSEILPTAFLAKPIHIIVIGAGISGIQFLRDATTELQNVTLEAYDKNPEIGGTWYENRYPGCACDVPAHAYQYSWNPNPRWSQMYAEAPEIFGYLKDTVDKHNLRQYLRLGQECIGAVWDESSAQWLVDFKRTGAQNKPYQVRCHVLVTDDQETIKKNATNPSAYYDFRVNIEKKLARSFAGLWSGSEASQRFTDVASRHMETHLHDHRMLKTLRPTFPAGCRRFTPATEYMEALNQPNVQLISSSIQHVEEDALITDDGERHYADMIVCATGFEPYKPRFSIIGRDGYDLAELWSDKGNWESYLAVSVANLPNFFGFNPPICPVNGSAYPGIERESNYMIRIIQRLQTDALKSVCVKQSAQSEFNEWVQSRMSEMVWSENCSSWYKRNDKVIVPWPGTILHYYAATEFIRWEDYELDFQTQGQKYASFGNGITEQGFTPESLPWLK